GDRGGGGGGQSAGNGDEVGYPSVRKGVAFNHGGLDVDPVMQAAGDVYALTLPAVPEGSDRPVFGFSDWMPVAPLARHDRGFGWLLLVRSYSDQFVRISSGGSPHRAIRRLHAGFCADGNLTIPPWTPPHTR